MAITVTNRTIISNITGNATVYEVSRAVADLLPFSYNSLTSVNAAGYQLLAGDETPGATNYNLDGAQIIGNKVLYNGAHAYGTDQAITHGIFLGYQLDAIIQHNYIERSPMAIIRKANGVNETTGAVMYNIIKNPYAVGVICKGMGGVKIYNNTFYSNQPTYVDENTGTWRGLIHITENPEAGGYATNIKIKNNIFYTTHQIYNIAILDAGDLTGFESDYNLFWCEAGDPVFNYLGDSKTFAEWQGLGYDTNSIVVNPYFVNLTNFIPAVALEYGVDLGASYDEGLATNATWIVGQAPATQTQGATWQVGAVIHSGAVDQNAYYVDPAGSDSNTGTEASPFKTIQYGVSQLSPSIPILYVREGTYVPNAVIGSGDGGSTYCGIYQNNRHGSATNLYRVLAYPGDNMPVVSGENLTGTSYSRQGLLFNNCSYWYIKGIRFVGFTQSSSPVHGGGGIQLYSCNHITVEQCEATENGGPGFQTRVPSGSENHFINCDSWYNYDPYSGIPGDNADGFDFGWCSNDRITRATGCRSWDNSDDGFDMYQGSGYSGIHYLTNCWAWRNGYIPGTSTPAGQGCGFKLGLDTSGNTSSTRKFLVNCIAAKNRARGFSQESAEIKKELYHCVAYANGTHGFSFYGLDVPDIVKNCISYDNSSSEVEAIGTIRQHDHNSWDIPISLVDGDFASIDETEMEAARQANGNLPVIDFMHPSGGGAAMVGVGISISSYTTDGDGDLWNNPPSIGAFEFGASSVTLVENIIVTGADNAIAILVDGGTLLMSATVLPAGATIKTVVWSVTSITGSATISSGGLLTAVSDGVVTVRATAVDGSDVFGILNITLYNQAGGVPASQTLAPDGWHVPTNTDWQNLLMFLYPEATDPGTNTVGGYLKTTGTAFWFDPNTGATNAYGFNAKGSGQRTVGFFTEAPYYRTLGYQNLKFAATYWSATEFSMFDTEHAYAVNLVNDAANFYAVYNGEGTAALKRAGYAVRLIKDNSINTGTLTDIDGNIYETITIGSQVWIASNYRCTRYADGTPIPNITDDQQWADLTTGAMCYYNNIYIPPSNPPSDPNDPNDPNNPPYDPNNPTTWGEGIFYSGDEDPTGTVRLNYEGYFYATKLFSGGVEVGTGGEGTTYDFINSIEESSGGVQLVNDQDDPGPGMYYGTADDSVGAKGWYALPEGGGGVDVSGTPTEHQVAFFLDNNTLQTHANFTYDPDAGSGSGVLTVARIDGIEVFPDYIMLNIYAPQGLFMFADTIYIGASTGAAYAVGISVIGNPNPNEKGKDLFIQAGLGNDEVGGSLYLIPGYNAGSEGGNYGDIYFGDGYDGYLPAKSSETNVVYYDPATGKLSYGTP